jgi:hypothetical protein
MLGESLYYLCVIGVPVVILSIFAFSGIAAAGMSIYSFVMMLQEIPQLGDWPVDVPCPLLWSDPAANWVWAIAK